MWSSEDECGSGAPASAAPVVPGGRPAVPGAAPGSASTTTSHLASAAKRSNQGATWRVGGLPKWGAVESESLDALRLRGLRPPPAPELTWAGKG